MSWFRVDDTWADSAKVDIISDVAARLWTICGTWCSKKENLKFDGKISRAALATITKRRWSDDILEAAIIELVETSKVGGLYEHGLWEPIEGGWRFHDWERYKPRDCDEPELSPQESGRIGGLRSAEARREKSGTAVPNNARNRRVTEGSPKPFGEGHLEGPSKKTHRRVTEATEAPDPDPDPRSDPEVGSQDLTGFPRDASLPPPPPPNDGAGPETETHPIAPPLRAIPQAFDLSHEQPKPQEVKRAPEGNLARLPTRRERATDDLMSCPIGELGKRCRLNPYDAGMSPVGDRAELRRVNEAWSRAVGLSPRPLGTYSDGNQPLKTLLDAFEIATEAELLCACEQASRDDWCTGRKGYERDPPRKRDIGCLSQTVLRRLLNTCEAARPKLVHPRVQAMLDADRKRTGGK